MVTFILNGREVEAEEGSTILQVAEANNITIPTLCNHEALEPAGLCRLCTVKVSKGAWSRFVTACNYPVWDGMEVTTDSQDVIRHRKIIVELLLARCPENGFVKGLATAFGVKAPRFQTDDDNCILCGLCVRVCQRMGQRVIDFSGRGTSIELAAPFKLPSDACMGCGSCAFICPTGYIRMERIEDEVVICTPHFTIARLDLEKCANCGEPYATRKYLDYVKERSRAGDWVIPETVMCPTCGRTTRAEGMALGEGGALRRY